MKSLASLALSAVALAILSPACAAPSDEAETEESTTESGYTVGRWQKLMTCDGGAAVLDVDSGDRRHAQFVIRDRRIVDYLQSKTPSPIVNGKHEIVIEASRLMTRGLFRPEDFGHDDFWRYHVADFGAHPGIVKRDGRGIKVILADDFRFVCEGDRWIPDGTGQCHGNFLRVDVRHEVANWYFRDCQ